MDTFFRRVVVEPLKSLLDKLLDFLPNFFTFILIFVSGVIVGLILRSVLLRFFRIIGLDAFSERSGLIAALQKGGIREPLSLVLAKLISWLVIAGFSIFALNALKLPAVEQVLESFILYLPNIFVGTIIFLFGYLLSNFLSRAVLIAGVNAGIRIAGVIAKLVRLTVFVLAVTMALEQLGIGRGTIVIAFAIILGGVVLALAIAFGLGGRDIAQEYLERKLKGEEDKDEISHL
ncbi:MAG TPA: hypothetical protein DCO77_10055 [Nitrospiraceae bacterium]|nr:hypothetical protein [Nitrospiraceae bacterium]